MASAMAFSLVTPGVAAGGAAIPAVLTGPFAYLALIGGGLIDAKFSSGLMRGKDASQPPELLDVPTASNNPGATRIWACGNRVRVPCHVLWQSSKIREETLNMKGSSGIVQKRVFIDAALSLNDRLTASMRQLIGNGRLLVWKDRNLVEIQTSEMTGAVSSGLLTLTMNDQTDPDFTDTFVVDNVVQLAGFVSTAGPSVNGLRFRVTAVTEHTSSATSSITLRPIENQTITGATVTGGSTWSPAVIERCDDIISPASWTATYDTWGPMFPAQYDGRRLRIKAGSGVVPDSHIGFDVIVKGNDVVAILGLSGLPSGVGATGRVFHIREDEIGLEINGTFPLTSNITAANISSTNQLRLIPQNAAPFSSLFPATFDPDEHFHSGSETQDPDSIMVDSLGAGNVPGYRGHAYQVIEQLECTQFANSLPFSLEGIIDIDRGMNWQEAIAAVLERDGFTPEQYDVSGVDPDIFEGFIIRGSLPTVSAIQPLLMAKQILTQERNGVLCFFQVHNADVVELPSDESKTVLGARLTGEQALDDEVTMSHGTLEDLPTSVSIYHQDPANSYGVSFQHFGLRSPSGVHWAQHTELNLRDVGMRAKDARQLCIEVLRRTWLTSTSLELMLDHRFIDLLENDIVHFNDRSGYVITARTTLVSVGANNLVKVQGVLERLSLSASSKAHRPGASSPSLVQPALVELAVMDLPALTPTSAQAPTLLIGAGATSGRWNGAAIFESADGGLSWQGIGFLNQESIVGTHLGFDAAASAETYGSTALTYDNSTVLTVELLTASGSFASCSTYEAEQLSKNWCAIQDLQSGEWEVAAFTVATQIGPTTWELSGWLRGLRGSPSDTDKPTGGKFVLLENWSANGLARAVPNATSGPSLLYRAVPVGASLDNVASEGVTPQWRSASPAICRKLVKTIGSSPYDVEFETENWTRQPLPLGAIGPYVMDESFEEYVFSIYDPTGTILRRTKRISTRTINGVVGSPNLRDRFVTYTAAEQIADGYTPSSSTTFVVAVQQVGDFGTSRLVKRSV